MNAVSSGLEVLSYVTHSFYNNIYLNSKVGIILGLYIQLFLCIYWPSIQHYHLNAANRIQY